MLLPLLFAALQMQSQADVEKALTDGVHARLAAGWTIVDMRTDDDELVVTMRDAYASQIEQHVAHIDGHANAYRIDVVHAFPQNPAPPDDFTVAALSGRGGLEIQLDCGHAQPRPYMIDARERGAAAARLVAKTLKDSSDLENATLEHGRAIFVLDVNQQAIDLIVAVDGDGNVKSAEVRRYQFGPDVSTNKKQRAMQRAVGEKVTQITEGDSGPVLHGAKRFAIDLYALERDADLDDGCGC